VAQLAGPRLQALAGYHVIVELSRVSTGYLTIW